MTDGITESRESIDTSGCGAAEDAAAMRDRINVLQRELNLYKREFGKAIECVDRVFQVEHNKPPPLLPDFLSLGVSKFQGVITLAEAYIALRAEVERLKAVNEQLARENHQLRGLLETAVDAWESSRLPNPLATYVRVMGLGQAWYEKSKETLSER